MLIVTYNCEYSVRLYAGQMTEMAGFFIQIDQPLNFQKAHRYTHT